MGFNSGTKDAKKAAAASEAEAKELRRQADLKKQRLAKEKSKADRIFQRGLRSRGGGYFESDSSSTLG